MQTDVLIIGGGLAGICAADQVTRNSRLRVDLLQDGSGASPFIHGFCLPFGPGDSPSLLEQDTLAAGHGIADPRLVHTLCTEASSLPAYFQELGLDLDGGPEGIRRLQPLGASVPRVVTLKNDSGAALLSRLRKRLGNTGRFREHARLRAISLLKTGDRVTGARCFDIRGRRWIRLQARTVILASGGFCGLFPFSTNSPDRKGDGIAMAAQAGAALTDMEFIQFEPSAAVWPPSLYGKSVITTMFYEGAVLRNAEGRRFMPDYNRDAECCSKEMLSACIHREIQNGHGTKNGGVYFDATAVPDSLLHGVYAPYFNRYQKAGIDISRQPMEIAPAAHTSIGGIRINTRCETTVSGLLACGEAAGGIHGAGRLGGNAGLEVMVFGRMAGRCAAEQAQEQTAVSESDAEILAGNPTTNLNLEEASKQLSAVLGRCMNVIRNGRDLKAGIAETEGMLSVLGENGDCYEQQRLSNDCRTALAAMKAALRRTETVGCHIREDADPA